MADTIFKANERSASWHNLRDLGGIELADGGCLKRGVLFRAGVVSELATASIVVSAHTIIDLRSNGERRRQPTPWQAFGAQDYWAKDHDGATGDLTRLLSDVDCTPAMRGPRW